MFCCEMGKCKGKKKRKKEKDHATPLVGRCTLNPLYAYLLPLPPSSSSPKSPFTPSLSVSSSFPSPFLCQFSFSVSWVSYLAFLTTGTCPSCWPASTASVSSLSLYHVLLCGAFSAAASSLHCAICSHSLSPLASIYPGEPPAIVDGC